MSALTSAQSNDASSSSALDDAATSLAGQLIDQLGSDGSLSLSDIETALGVDGGSSGASTTGASATGSLSSAFASLDTNGDGKLSASELASGIEDAVSSGPSGPPPGPPPDASGISGSTSGTSTSATSSLASPSSDSSETSGQLALALRNLLMQFAQSQSAEVGDSTSAATQPSQITA